MISGGRVSCLVRGAAALVFFAPAAASAGSFDATGAFHFDPFAVVTLDLEDGVMDDTALAGTRVLSVGPWQGYDAALALPAADASYVARLFVRSADVYAQVRVTYEEGDAPQVVSQLFPTGRMTSDGWMELESAPFSVAKAGKPSSVLRVYGPNGVVADAGEIVPQGDFRPAEYCAGAADASSCREDELCMSRHCVDGRGTVPPIPADKARMHAYLRSRIEALFGPYEGRKTHMPKALAALDEQLVTKSRYRYWAAFARAIRLLSDSHTSAFATWQFSYDGKGRIPLNACFLGGHADAKGAPAPGPATPDVLVSHAGKVGSWGLVPGDRVVAVDGMPPLDFVRSLVDEDWGAPAINDPTSLGGLFEALPRAISRSAITVTLERCGGDPSKCVVETVKVADQKPPTEPVDGVDCDFRPKLHVAGAPEDHGFGDFAIFGPALESKPGEEIHGMIWNSLNGQGKVLGDISAAVKSWKDAAARGVILDHRIGNGGTFNAATPILNYAITPREDVAFVWRRRADDTGPTTAEEGLALFEQYKGTGVWPTKVGSPQAKSKVPVALLVTRDVSASDYMPHAMKGEKNVRIFGPTPTNGAFSTFLGFQIWMGVTAQIACGDTIEAGTGKSLCGTGVAPDVVVLPKQTDLMAGKDPVYDAALQWVRENLAP